MRFVGKKLMPNRCSSSIAKHTEVSEIYERLKLGPMKRLYKYYTPEAINLAGGLPMDSTFPVKRVEISGEHLSYTLQAGNNLWLNYQRGDGLPPMKKWIENHVSELHGRPDVSSCITVGSTDALAKIYLLLKGDAVMMDQFAYGTAISGAKALGRQPVGVKMDKDGMIPEDLRKQTIRARECGLRPDILYSVPLGQNPTGNSVSFKRKKELYKVCEELDLMIVEDDAYYYIHFENDSDPDSLPGLHNLPRSFLSMDPHGRVLRLDSLSKFVAPGFRLGWIAGPKEFIEKYTLFQEMTTQFPSGLSQSAFVGLLDQWGDDGLDSHLKKTQLHYKNQRNTLVQALQSVFQPGVIEFSLPTAGMFIWIKFIDESFRGVSSEDLFKQLAESGVVVVPGEVFYVDPASESTESRRRDLVFPSIRLTFANATPEQLWEGVRRLKRSLETR